MARFPPLVLVNVSRSWPAVAGRRMVDEVDEKASPSWWFGCPCRMAGGTDSCGCEVTARRVILAGMSIRGRRSLNLLTFDQVLVPDDDEVVTVDLSMTEFIDAYGLVGVTCHIAEAVADGRAVKVLTPEHDAVARYLSRMHLPALLEEYDVAVDWPFPWVGERDQQDSLIELENFSDAGGSDRLAEFLWHRLMEGGADPQVVDDVFNAAGELCNNVVEHAQSASGGWVAAQRYQADQPSEYLVLAVGDVGIGISRSLSRRYGWMDDEKAVAKALELYVSSVDDPGRGQGLTWIAEALAGLRGSVWVRSGAAARRVTKYRSRGEQVSHLQGTIVAARVPCRPGG